MMTDKNVISIQRSEIDYLGDEFDLFAIVRNTSDKAVILYTYCDNCGKLICTDASGGPHLLAPNATFGIAADREGYRLLVSLEADSYYLSNELDDIVDFIVNGAFHVNDCAGRVCLCNRDCEDDDLTDD